MLKLSNVKKSYPQRGLVLNGLNLEIKEGDSVAIKGPSGSGKTTLLNIIGLLDRADSGIIMYKDIAINTLGTDEAALYRRESIGFVFQDHLLLPHLSIIDNIYLPLLAGKKHKETIKNNRDYIDSLLERTGISHIAEKLPHTVSGGEAQRATLVRALANKPALILADEPTGSLDNENSNELGKLLGEINNEFRTSIISVTHSDSFADFMKDIYQLNNGILDPVRK